MTEPRWRRYLRFWKRNLIADVDDELQHHFEQRIAQYQSGGMSRSDAEAAARAQFGDVTTVRAELVGIDERVAKRLDGLAWLGGVGADVRTSLRSLRRQPAFAAAVVITLALGLGVNAAMFSFLDRVYLRPPSGIQDPGTLRRLWTIEHDAKGERAVSRTSLSVDEFTTLTAMLGKDASLVLFGVQPNVRFGTAPDRPIIAVTRAQASYLPLLGVHAAFGRLFTSAEAQMSASAQVVVISDLLWRTRLGADSSVLGKVVKLNGMPFTVIGVAPPDFADIDLSRTDAWIPMAEEPIGMPAGGRPMGSGPSTFGVLARLAPGVNDASLEARVTAIVRRRAAERSDEDSLATVVTGSIIEARGPGRRQQELSFAGRLGGVAFIVLLIACANVVNLLLARAIARRREIAVRVALGISRSRLVWLLSVESLILATAAGVAAVASAQATGGLLRSRLVPNIQFADPPLHWRVVAATMLGALLAGAVAGIVPAIQASRPDVKEFLKSGARDGVVHRSWLRSTLVAAQAALSVVLLVGAALFVSSLRNVEGIQLGYEVSHVASASVAFDDWRPHDSVTFARAAERVRHVPGVQDLAMTTYAPMDRGLLGGQFYTTTDSGRGDYRERPSLMMISPNYFSVTGMRIVRGTGFAADPGLSIVVNETMARQYWPEGNAVGQCVRLNKRESPCYTVVGIVTDAHRLTLIEEAHAQYYVPLAHPPARGMPGYNMLIRAEPANMNAVLGATRRILADEFPQGYPMISRMEDTIAPAYRPFRLGALLFGVFGLLALLVASVGVYSSVSYTVSQRTHEFGVRTALGATLGDVLRAVLRGALAPVVVGIVVGIGVALAAGRLIAAFLYGISPTNVTVMIVVAGLLLLAAIAAAIIPARRAARVDPLIALRAD